MNKFDKEGLTSNKVISDVIITSDGQLYLTSDAADSRYMPIDAEVGGGETHVVGEQWISFDGTIPVGGIPFLGQIVHREQYKELYDFIKKNNRHKTEAEWQTISDTNKGNVPYYAIDEIAGVNASATNWSYVSYDISAINVVKDGNIIETITFDEPFSFVDGFDTTALETLVNEKSNLITLTVLERASESNEETGQLDVFYPLTFTYNEAGTIGNDVRVNIVGTDSITVEQHILYGGVDCVPSETIRMPKFNGYFKGADEAGNYVAEGLPNITGAFKSNYTIAKDNATDGDGAIVSPYMTTEGKYGSSTAAVEWGYGFTFDASASNPIYGNSEHVTPETNTVIVGVYAFGAIINNSNIDVEDIIHAYESNDKVIQSFEEFTQSFEEFTQSFDSKLDSIQGQVITNTENIEGIQASVTQNSKNIQSLSNKINSAKFVTTSWRSGNNWYRKYSDGWIEQGGQTGNISGVTATTISLNTAFTTTNYYANCIVISSNYDTGYLNGVTTKSKTSFKYHNFLLSGSGVPVSWYACGY